MAAVTGAVIGGLGLGLGALQTIEGKKQQKAGEAAMNSFERQDLSNAFENTPISTLGSDYLREQSQLATAGAVEAARTGGSRAIIGTLPKIIAANNDANRAGQIYLDDQVNKRNYAIAGDNVRIQGMQEQRDNDDLAGIGNAIQTGRQDAWSGMRGMLASGGYLANNLPQATRPEATSISPEMSPAGVVPAPAQTPTATLPTSYNPFSSIDWSKFNYGF